MFIPHSFGDACKLVDHSGLTPLRIDLPGDYLIDQVNPQLHYLLGLHVVVLSLEQ
jgi:hypothetical protein